MNRLRFRDGPRRVAGGVGVSAKVSTTVPSDPTEVLTSFSSFHVPRKRAISFEGDAARAIASVANIAAPHEPMRANVPKAVMLRALLVAKIADTD